MAKNQIVPVYLITGFLEAGKTTFLNETLCDPEFNRGEKTLVLLCEEGIEELSLADMPSGSNVEILNIESADDINKANFVDIQKKYKPERIMVEYNGMWGLDLLYTELPDAWQVCQEFMFVDGSTFENYNSNMRTLMVDKFTSANTVIFNRCKKDFDKMFFHKSVRAVSRGANIIYEYNDANKTVESDNIVDPLPFDFNADTVKIEDKDFAWFYRDIAEDPKKYDGKTVCFKGLCAVDQRFPKGSFVIGRHVMVCCEADTAYRAFACDGFLLNDSGNGSWITITAKIKYEYHKIYKSEGPVLKMVKYEKAEKPEQIVATFM